MNKPHNEAYKAVRTFHESFHLPYEDKPTLLTEERAQKRAAWMREEIEEFIEAVQDKDLVGQADAMIDLIYFAFGTLVEAGIEPNDLFNIVHQANMDKLWEDGKPRYREDGKVIKPKNWEAPEPKLADAVTKQLSK